MRSKKAGKRLEKVETLLSKVIDRYAKREPTMITLLDSAKESVVRAKAVLHKGTTKNGRKPLEKAKGKELALAGLKALI